MGNRMSAKTGSACGSIPFYAAPESLPEDLPSCQEIEAASDGDVLSDKFRTRVVRVGSNFVVKYGLETQVLYGEGRTLLFLERNRQALPSLRFPRLYAMFTKGRKTFLIMESLEGQPLKDVKTNKSLWSTYSDAEKNAIATILRDGIQELRCLKSPKEGHYCGVDGAPLPDILSFSPRRTQLLSGPFATQEEWNDALVNMTKVNVTPHRFEFIRRCVDSVLTGHSPPVFTHGDLQRKNILVHAEAGTLQSSEKKKTFQVSLLDWESAGWYPTYWEYFVAIWTCHSMEDDFALYVDSLILDDSYRVEFALCREVLASALCPTGCYD